MDPLTRETYDHEKFYEMIPFYEKAIKKGSGLYCLEQYRELDMFFDAYIVEHFNFEDRNIFLPVLTFGTEGENKYINDLKDEHVSIRELVVQFKELLKRAEATTDGDMLRQLDDSTKLIIRKMMDHIYIEDKQLPLLIKKYTNFRE